MHTNFPEENQENFQNQKLQGMVLVTIWYIDKMKNEKEVSSNTITSNCQIKFCLNIFIESEKSKNIDSLSLALQKHSPKVSIEKPSFDMRK